MRRPLGENDALYTFWPDSTWICLPFAASHTRAAPSNEVVTMRLPSGENNALYISLRFPARRMRISCRSLHPTLAPFRPKRL